MDAIIKKDYASLAAKTTFLYVGFYPQNLVNIPNAKPFTNPGTYGNYFWLMPSPRTTVLPSAGDTSVNVGLFVKASLEQPEKTHGKYVASIVDTPTVEEFLKLWTAATGKPSAYIQADGNDWSKAYGAAGEELWLNLRAFEENPKWYLDNEPLLAKDLGIEGDVISTEAALKSFGDTLL